MFCLGHTGYIYRKFFEIVFSSCIFLLFSIFFILILPYRIQTNEAWRLLSNEEDCLSTQPHLSIKMKKFFFKTRPQLSIKSGSHIKKDKWIINTHSHLDLLGVPVFNTQPNIISHFHIHKCFQKKNVSGHTLQQMQTGNMLHISSYVSTFIYKCDFALSIFFIFFFWFCEITLCCFMPSNYAR